MSPATLTWSTPGGTYAGVRYRTVVTDLDCGTLTFLDKLASDRSFERSLCKPATAVGHVPSWNPEVNIPHTDGEAFVGFADRLVFMLRRDELGATPYSCQFSGILNPLQDQAEADEATSTFTASDPWQLLYQRPVVRTSTLLPVGPGGWKITGQRADQIIMTILDNMEAFCGTGPHADAFIDRGQGTGYDGTIESTDVISSITFDENISVGEAFDQLVEAGYCEIILQPIYDPRNRPGLIVELNVYQTAGEVRANAIMAWDKPSRSLVGLDRLYAEPANKIAYRISSGTDTTDPDSVPIQTNAASVARYGELWAQKTISAPANARPMVTTLAATELFLRARGKQTITARPVPLRSPIPFFDYTLGDQLPVWASRRFREPVGPTLASGEWVGLQRVWGIKISLANDGLETVDQLLLSKEGDT